MSAGHRVRDDDARALAVALSSNTTLTELSLEGGLSNGFCYCVICMLTTVNKLEVTGARAIADALKSSTTLTSLSITSEFGKSINLRRLVIKRHLC